MNKFLNYVRKFLALSFISTAALFSLQFNNIYAANGKQDESKPAKEEDSQLGKIFSAWKNWIIGPGKEEPPLKQYQKLKKDILAIIDSLDDEEKEAAKKLVEEIDDTIEKLKEADKNTSTTTTTKKTTSTATAKTKTADSYFSPELLSLILSGSFTGLLMSLKRRRD